MNILTKLKDCLSKKEKAEIKYLYKDLAPVDDIDSKSEYFNALNWSLSNKKISNIALSGPYGAGKSSVIDSYLKGHEIKAIRVSLANFTGTEKLQAEDIEKEFLKQLFYKVDYKKIPQSRYRKLRKISAKRLFEQLVLTEMIFVMGAAIVAPDKTKNVLQSILNASSIWGLPQLVGNIAIILTTVMLNIAVSRLLKWTFSKCKNWEINIFDKARVSSDTEKEESIFNRYLDEIVYFFEETKYEVVFVEDLDRFNNTDIFVTLRELNQILNGYESIKEHITFVYAIRDDFFANSTERTKFFDYIIPVIPYINSTNSGDLLRRRLTELTTAGISINLEDSYITQVSPYISDMRVLTCIVNEFLLYKKTQVDDKDLGLRDEIMLSLMIFKNLYPMDFAELESERGIVKNAFECKKTFINKKTVFFQEEADEIHRILEEYEQDHIKSVLELKVAMLSAVTGDCYVRSISNNRTGENFSRDTIMSADFDLTKLVGNLLNIQIIRPNGNTADIQIQDINAFTQNGKNFFERWKVLKEAEGDRREQLKDEFEQKQCDIYELKALKLKDIINKYGVDDLFDDSEDIRENRLLIFLLRNGYIDENYANYINYFHPDSITADEQSFILNVRNHGGTREFDEVIPHKSRVIERLLIHEFRQEEILNFDIVEHVISSKDEHGKRKELMQLLALRTEKTKEFIKRYIQARADSAHDFIKELAQYNDYLWKDISIDETIPEATKEHYFDLIITSAQISDLKRSDGITESSIKKYICSYPDIFSKIKGASLEKLIECIDELDIIFDDLAFEATGEEISDYIIQNNRFAINSSMFARVVAYKNPEIAERFLNGNYAALLELKDADVLNYANENIEEYIEKVVVQEKNNQESVEAVLVLSDLLGFDIAKISRVLDSQQICISSLNQIIDYETEENEKEIKEYIDYCLKNTVAEINWKNINLYFEKYGLSTVLLSQIIDNIHGLTNEVDGPEATLFRTVLQEEWPDDAYRLLVQKYKLDPYDIPVSAINEAQTETLIEEELIPFNMEYATELAESYPSLRLKYFVVGKNTLWDFIEDIDVDIIPIDEISLDNSFTEEEKLRLLSMVNSKDLTINMARFIKDCKKNIHKSYVLAAWDLLPDEEKYELLINHISVLDNDELSEIFNSLAEVYHPLASRTKHKITIDKTSYNERLLAELKKKDYLTSFTTEWINDESKAHLFTSNKKEVLAGWVKEYQN